MTRDNDRAGRFLHLRNFIPVAEPGHCPYCLLPAYDVEDGERCHGHLSGPPIATPNTTTAHDVAQLQLFPLLAFKTRSSAWRDDEWREWRARVMRDAEEARVDRSRPPGAHG